MCGRHKPWEKYVRVILVLVQWCSNNDEQASALCACPQMLYTGASESLRESSLLPKKRVQQFDSGAVRRSNQQVSLRLDIFSRTV